MKDFDQIVNLFSNKLFKKTQYLLKFGQVKNMHDFEQHF